MKKTKIIIPALGMLLLSTAASVTGTVAWFSMNSFVNATNMNIKAKAENGIVIATTMDSATWTDTADHNISTALAVYPTSTKDGSTWVHSSSNSANAATSNGNYTMLSADANWGFDATTGAGYLNKNGLDNYQTTAGTAEGYTDKYDEAYCLKQSFYVKSSAEAISKNIYITKVSVTSTNNSVDLDKSLRVLVKHSTTAKVFAPSYAANAEGLTYSVCTSITPDDPETPSINEYAASKESVTAIGASGVTVNTLFLSNQAIPAYSANSSTNPTPLQFDIYLYFEGEDANCKSANITETLSSLSVEVEFGTTERAVNP